MYAGGSGSLARIRSLSGVRSVRVPIGTGSVKMEFTLVTAETNRVCLSLKSQNKDEALLLKYLQGAKLEVWIRDDQNSELEAEAYLWQTTSLTT